MSNFQMKMPIIAIVLLTVLALSSCVEPAARSDQSATKTPLQTSTPLPTAIPSPSPTATSIPLSEQKSPDWEISNIKIVPFDWDTGEFQEELESNEAYGGQNEFSISLFVVVEASSQAYYDRHMASEKVRKVEITVMEDKRQKAKKIERIILLGEGGKIFVPVWLDPTMCGDVKINARIIGQKTVSTMKRTVLFECGE